MSFLLGIEQVQTGVGHHRPVVVLADLEKLAETAGIANEDSDEQCKHMRDKVRPLMEELRTLGDELETRIAADLWCLPSYRELLFIK